MDCVVVCYADGKILAHSIMNRLMTNIRERKREREREKEKDPESHSQCGFHLDGNNLNMIFVVGRQQTLSEMGQMSKDALLQFAVYFLGEAVGHCVFSLLLF